MLSASLCVTAIPQNILSGALSTVEMKTTKHTKRCIEQSKWNMQVLTHLKLGNYKLGLLLNFRITTLKNEIKRIINQIHSTLKKELTVIVIIIIRKKYEIYFKYHFFCYYL